MVAVETFFPIQPKTLPSAAGVAIKLILEMVEKYLGISESL